MIINNKNIVQWILVKTKTGLGYERHLEDRFYILAEIEIKNGKDDNLIFYDLTEERFFSRSRWFIERSIVIGTADIIVNK